MKPSVRKIFRVKVRYAPLRFLWCLLEWNKTLTHIQQLYRTLRQSLTKSSFTVVAEKQTLVSCQKISWNTFSYNISSSYFWVFSSA